MRGIWEWFMFITSIATTIKAMRYWYRKNDIECLRWLIITLILAQVYL